MQKNILVVGGSSGIGLSLIKMLSAQGHQIMHLSRTQSEVLQELHIPHITWDVKNPLPITLENDLPDTLHGLVYCPGTINLKPFHRLTEDEFLEDFQVNVLGAVKILQASLKSLKKAKQASVVLYSTVAARLGMNFHSSIAVAKSGVEGLCKSLAAEWAMYGIRVNAIAPSLTDTPLASKLLSSDEKREASAKRHPLGKIGQPEDIASLTAFLLSDQANWITGQMIGVDGGMGALKP